MLTTTEQKHLAQCAASKSFMWHRTGHRADMEFLVASIETAIAAAGHVRLKRMCDRLEVASRSVNAANDEPGVDTEGSIRFWQRRKKNCARHNSSQDLILHSRKEGNHPMALTIALFIAEIERLCLPSITGNLLRSYFILVLGMTTLQSSHRNGPRTTTHLSTYQNLEPLV